MKKIYRRPLVTRFKDAKPLTLEEELALCETIAQGKEFIGDEAASSKEQDLANKALRASHHLVSSYSYLIETIARQRFQSAGAYSDVEEFISEAYIVALQCALTFNPHASKRQVIRFSSYAPLAITSALKQLSLKSRSIVNIPSSMMSDARAWSHTKFDMQEKGIDVSDASISLISGIDATQEEIYGVLRLTEQVNNEDMPEPWVKDSADNARFDEEYDELKRCFDDPRIGKEYASILYKMLGIEGENVAVRPHDLYVKEPGVNMKQATMDLHQARAMLHHPVVRVMVARRLRGQAS